MIIVSFKDLVIEIIIVGDKFGLNFREMIYEKVNLESIDKVNWEQLL